MLWRDGMRKELLLLGAILLWGCGKNGMQVADSGAAGTGGGGGTGGTSSVDCATVGCSAPPLCSAGCTATCGCCACAEGEHSGDLVCHGGCYVPTSTDGGAVTDARDADAK